MDVCCARLCLAIVLLRMLDESANGQTVGEARLSWCAVVSIGVIDRAQPLARHLSEKGHTAPSVNQSTLPNVNASLQSIVFGVKSDP